MAFGDEHARRIIRALEIEAQLPPTPEGWAERCDRADLAALQQRCATGEALANVAALEVQAESRRRIEYTRQLAAIEGVRGGRAPGDALHRAAAYVAAAPGGEHGAQRNPTAWGVVLRTVRGFALVEAEALELLAADYAPRCRPALPRRELVGMVRRAVRAGRPPWGYLLDRGAA